MPDASLNTMVRIRTTLYNQKIRSEEYRASNQVPRGLSLATVGANDQRNNKILEQDSYIIPDSPFRRPPKISFPGSSYLLENIYVTLYFNNQGGPVTQYSAPILPTGLTIDSTTGLITGIPTELSELTNYTIEASNAFGSDTIIIQLSVIQQPPNIFYNGSPFTFTQGLNINPIRVTNTGGTTNITYSGTLPNGLSLGATSGTISGTPTIENIILPSVTSYNITATNPSGSSTTTIVVNMNQAAPTFDYPPGTYFLNGEYYYVVINKREITPIIPLNVFTPITFRIISSSIPSRGNLTVNSTTGVITGIAYASGGFSFFIKGQNITGEKIVFLQFLGDACPPVFSYSPNTYTFTQNTTITDINIVQDFNVSDGFRNSSISPALPSGLHFDPATAKISGTPLVVSSTQTYTVTADGLQRYSPQINGTATITITVNPPAPFITYISPQTYTVGTAISPLSPTNSGGTVSSYSDITGLPAGLILNTSTGVISGTPTTAGSGTYLIRATNVTGTSVATINITIII